MKSIINERAFRAQRALALTLLRLSVRRSLTAKTEGCTFICRTTEI